MGKTLFKWCTLALISLFPVLSNAQTNNEDLLTKNTSVEFKNDTLFYSNGLKLFVGQKLIIGNAAGQTGQYRSIISKKAALVPSIWGQDMRYENAIENYQDTKRNKEKVKNSLIPGNLLTITKISYQKSGKPYCYLVWLSSDKDVYKCDIKFALIKKELFLQP